ncbi:MAG: tetratricopeptide repeat protein [Candidatus Sumerlaeota bacterium]|nr:tetratricopeptide repeat protein [Candidatus Sumerlaeota bacterium]
MSEQFQMRIGRTEPPPSLTGKGPLPLRGPRRPNLSRALASAQAALRAGDAQTARDVLEPLLEAYPLNPHLLIHLARAQAAAGDPEAATQTFIRAKVHTANSPIVDFYLGHALLQHDRLAEAEEALRRCLEKGHQNQVASNLLALCLFRQGRHREAFAEWNRVGWSHNAEFLIDFTIAFERYLLETPEPGAPDLPDVDTPLRPVGMLEERRGFVDNAVERWKVRRLLARAERALTGQKTREAWRLTGQALALSPNDPDALLLQAVAMYELGRYQQSGRILLEVLKQDSSILPRCFLAYCLLRLGAVEVAEAILVRNRVEGPYDYYMHYHLGLCCLIRGDAPGARRYFGIAYRDYFIDSREYCFEYLIQRVRSAVERMERTAAAQ